jgi:hypothetical protein
VPPRTAREGCQLLLGLGAQTAYPRPASAGIWFRLIRTIIDELGATLSECRTAGRMILRIWKEAGYPFRAGPLRWHPYEDYPLDVQLHTLEATATTIYLLESKTLTGQGLDAALFQPYAACTRR